MRIAIIGAGISGLAAAHALSIDGAGIELFDKGRRPGGRMASRQHEGFEFDHGAQYFTAREPQFQDMVNLWQVRGLAEPWAGTIGSYEMDSIKTVRSDIVRFVGVPDMNAPTRMLASDFTVHTSTQVNHLLVEDRSLSLVSSDGAHLGSFDRVLITTPPAQAAPLVRASTKLSSVLRLVSMQPCWAVMCGFQGPLDTLWSGLFVNESPLSWVARNSSKPGRQGGEAWVLHASPKWSSEHLEDSPESVATTLLSALGKVLCADLPRATFTRAHRWLYSQPKVPLSKRSHFDPTKGLGLAGDWCGGPKVEGAYLSGLDLASRVLA